MRQAAWLTLGLYDPLEPLGVGPLVARGLFRPTPRECRFLRRVLAAHRRLTADRPDLVLVAGIFPVILG